MGAANSSKPEQDRRIARVIDWVHRHYARALTVEAAARLVHISPAAFSRFFSREVGKTFTQYINDVRCSEACIRLRSSDKPVALIAQECGFDTMSHFNRQFRARTGASPLAYRREP
jgi:AraC-like DNA-binding protein